MWNTTCNSTLEHLEIDEKVIVGDLRFHDLALIIGAASALIAILLSFYLILMHATHYTVPYEQKHIIRILFMVPVYATSSFLSLKYFRHAIYFQVLSDCYEAFAISSFFSLMCHYIGPDLHEQKMYFRDMYPIKPWVWPLDWFRACCCGEKGPWRTPKSGLTWFNIIWIGVYHYCFVRVAGTITAVVTQYFGKYCESSNSPVFAHVWVIVAESVAVTIAMYCLIQFYVQLRNTEQLAPNRPFLKILAIKLVIFLSFWQSVGISLGTSTLEIIKPNEILAYPDLKVGIPSLLLCFEMAWFALLHLWAFPWRGYTPRDGMKKKGGFLGVKAIFDAINIWDVAKGFGRGMRWLCVGVKNRRDDISYQVNMDGLPSSGQGKRRGFDNVNTQYTKNLGMSLEAGSSSTQHLPIANQFRASQWYDRRHQFRKQLGLSPSQSRDDTARHSEILRSPSRDESAGLIQNAAGFNSPGPSPSPYSSQQSPYNQSPHQQYQMPRSPRSGPSPYLSPRLDSVSEHPSPGHQPQQMSVSSMGSDALSLSNQWTTSDLQSRHEDRRPSYVSMDTELYTATVATPVNVAASSPNQQPGQLGGSSRGRNLT
ncbi:organic solute transporter Ostalpha-domain-containing protein [Cercophora newfieldiana]|uniref:Organic solute transporter Ostalpha-domain-containing protein n=1 Tax=Cercophora newfieldiana TaxID=92897 RepID=A0AA40CNZ3_9PEZI|nr:organic solute transporter Ostalpha-domain-containing protein [Cercophora newfieldiana]